VRRLLAVGASLPGLVLLFALAGIYIAVVDSMERALAADLLPLERRGTGYGALAYSQLFGRPYLEHVVGLLWRTSRLLRDSGMQQSFTNRRDRLWMVPRQPNSADAQHLR